MPPSRLSFLANQPPPPPPPYPPSPFPTDSSVITDRKTMSSMKQSAAAFSQPQRLPPRPPYLIDPQTVPIPAAEEERDNRVPNTIPPQEAVATQPITSSLASSATISMSSTVAAAAAAAAGVAAPPIAGISVHEGTPAHDALQANAAVKVTRMDKVARRLQVPQVIHAVKRTGSSVVKPNIVHKGKKPPRIPNLDSATAIATATEQQQQQQQQPSQNQSEMDSLALLSGTGEHLLTLARNTSDIEEQGGEAETDEHDHCEDNICDVSNSFVQKQQQQQLTKNVQEQNTEVDPLEDGGSAEQAVESPQRHQEEPVTSLTIAQIAHDEKNKQEEKEEHSKTTAVTTADILMSNDALLPASTPKRTEWKITLTRSEDRATMPHDDEQKPPILHRRFKTETNLLFQTPEQTTNKTKHGSLRDIGSLLPSKTKSRGKARLKFTRSSGTLSREDPKAHGKSAHRRHKAHTHKVAKRKKDPNARKSYVKGKVIDRQHELYTLSFAVMLGLRTSIGTTNGVLASSQENLFDTKALMRQRLTNSGLANNAFGGEQENETTGKVTGEDGGDQGRTPSKEHEGFHTNLSLVSDQLRTNTETHDGNSSDKKQANGPAAGTEGDATMWLDSDDFMAVEKYVFRPKVRPNMTIILRRRMLALTILY